MMTAVVLVAALVAQAPSREARPPDTDETVSVSKGARLTVENFAGEVIVRTWNRDAVRVRARHASRAKVEIRPVAAGLAVRTTSGARGSVDYEITAPEWMPVRVHGTYNFITVEGAQSEVSAETTRGDVVVKGGTGVVNARSIQGAVFIEGARGRITASSVNEGIRITDTSGDITAETTNGDIAFVQVRSANVEASTINGDIRYDGQPAERGRYRFTTHNGDITIAIPTTASLTFFVRTYNGRFGSAIPLNGPPREEVRQGRRMTYTLGSGSAEMELETFGGEIRVRAAGGTAPPKQPK